MMNTTPAAVAAEEAEAAPAWTGRRVLVVEDSVVQRGYLVGLLRQLNFGEVLEAGDGNEALRVLEQQEQPLYLVLTDLEMPGMDGIELTCQLRERRLTENLIVVSARDPRLLEIIESMACEDASIGLLGTLLKPVQLDSLTQLLCKASGRGAGCAPPVSQSLPPQASLEQLAQALTRREFVPWFQPKIAMQNGHLKGLEALARWKHPQRGLLSPAHFIDTLEGHPIMADFTLDLVQQVLDRIIDWQAHGLPPLTVSINLSADNLADRSFIDRLMARVSKSGVSPSVLVWEVTETSVMRQLSQALTNMGRLRLAGYGLAMDDFGIGYSSMQQFARCPFTELKIDRAFVNGAAQWPNRHMVLKSALDLGQSLGVATVAEGVETVEDWKLLRDLGCDMAQGYLLAKPMPAEELVGWIRQDRRRLRALAGEE
ncbi:EAL domain, c-di-GMP-specific phosphodiesterase class I (or its enzymatically inactive variant) [Duganella sp. CF402]|uniref:EAL domain-containing response regulator n=1 Tax=unclassified Duganella TaxID=2636909 RepID=UPI0008ABF026|nr:MULTISPECIES: EAL domain-containing response regulator [unclassified Duganella]RZT05943.1 EAL domain-containing protein (putative c-di-GMP-specific phosphodiesterase class I) [Duganella sp. BK701]SEN16134.1 EAL domain, c-di-GMP-specific phosphodiesterase class I (or its enzymatically inactive variant) [Duganella sp. CF402]